MKFLSLSSTLVHVPNICRFCEKTFPVCEFGCYTQNVLTVLFYRSIKVSLVGGNFS